ncbi:MAG: site-2 protease family protein [bacterium]
MISSLFSNPEIFIYSVIALLLSIAVHEFAHAWSADYLGDPTARLQGRLTLNPLKHIDLYGGLFLLFFGFGWGKAVPFDPYNLKNPRKDAAIISFAGPLSNFILAIASALLLKLFILLHLSFLLVIGYNFLTIVIMINVMLGVFNLLPINPLDGFKIVGGILPEEKAHQWYELERYGMIFLLLMIFPFGSGSMLDLIIHPIISFITQLLIPNITGGII